VNVFEVAPAWLYLAPALILVAGILLVPLLYAFWLSVHADNANILTWTPFVGLKNYISVFTSPDFIASASRTFYFAAVSLAIQLPLGMAIALLLNEKFIGRNILRALILIPWALPTIVNGALWMWIYQTGYGALNGLLLQVGLIDQPIVWLGSPMLAMNMVIVADTWKVLPFYVILLLAALQTIPGELYQAAAVDGANSWQRYRHITLPSLKPMLLIILVLRTVDTFRVFDIVYQITQGGPGGGTSVVAYQAYLTSFLQLQFGQGAAVAFVIAAAILILAVIYLRLLSSEGKQ
jgi:multiple sugar transport system permease protein/N,N'-diacetylchitobiose transport system permease protein